MKVLEKKFVPLPDISGNFTIDNSLPDLSEHPVVKAKVERARKFLEEHPVPERLHRK
jgi:hypothetical protein